MLSITLYLTKGEHELIGITHAGLADLKYF
jgi:hypothetical protein